MKKFSPKEGRAAKDLGQQLTEAAGVSRQTINSIEKGNYNPAINICHVLDKTLDELFWEE